MPDVSVIVPTFNAEAFIEETLSSILDQRGCEFEVIVIDDASSDSTVERIERIGDPRVRLIVNTINHGLPGSMNLAMTQVRGKYIARMDHDDIALPDRLAAQSRFLDDNPHITAVGTQIQHFGLDDYVTQMPLDDATIKALFIRGADYFANPSAMWRADFVRDNHIAYDANLYVVDDLGFWFDCMLCGANFANLPDVLLRYRIHARMTSKKLNAKRIYQSKRRLYKRMLPTYFPRLDGRACDVLLNLFEIGTGGEDSLSHMREMHEALAVALVEVDSTWGQDTNEAKGALIWLMNVKRAELANAGKLQPSEIAEFDRIFYDSLGQQD